MCGDSATNPLKARGYAYEHDNRLLIKCHNCGISTVFGQMLKTVDPLLYKEYMMETFKEHFTPDG
ncbi:MAG: DNA primase, partial [Candidatus Dormibacteria bacterium]